MNTTAEVYLWGTRIGIIHQDINKLLIIQKNQNNAKIKIGD